MSPEVKNLLITGPFVLILLFLLVWLARALIPTHREIIKQQTQDKFDQAGYEPMDSIQRKEYSVIGLSILVIVLILGAIGGLGYLLFNSGISSVASDQQGLNTIIIYVPAIVFLILIIAGSTSYMKRQQHTLREYKEFRGKRAQAIEEYQAKRSGKTKEEQKEEKTVQPKKAPQKKETSPPKARRRQNK